MKHSPHEDQEHTAMDKEPHHRTSRQAAALFAFWAVPLGTAAAIGQAIRGESILLGIGIATVAAVVMAIIGAMVEREERGRVPTGPRERRRREAELLQRMVYGDPPTAPRESGRG